MFLALSVSKANALLLPIVCRMTYFITDVFCSEAIFLLFLHFCLFAWRRWLWCHTVLESVSAPLCPPIGSNATPSTLSILPCTDSITHSYSFTKRSLLEECCWANGMTVLVIWKLPAVCAFYYWQWCSRRIYGSGKSLVNLFLFFRCHLCANEAIEGALYAVAYTFVGSGVLNGHLLVVMLYWCYRIQWCCTDVTESTTAESQPCACVLFPHHGSRLSHLKKCLNSTSQIQFLK